MPNSIESKKKILKEFLTICKIEGWSNDSLEKSFKNSKIDTKNIKLFFSDGIYSLIDFYFSQGNLELERRSKEIDLAGLKIRNKIKKLIKIRLLIEEENKEVLKKLNPFFETKPKNFKKEDPKILAILIKNNYKIADLMWKLISDESVDINFYTKRAILSKVFFRTFIVFMRDDSQNNHKTWQFLDQQIDDVMKIAKIKAAIKDIPNFSCKLKKNIKTLSKKLPFFRLIKINNKI